MAVALAVALVVALSYEVGVGKSGGPTSTNHRLMALLRTAVVRLLVLVLHLLSVLLHVSMYFQDVYKFTALRVLWKMMDFYNIG